MYDTQVSRRRKPASKIEKLLCIFQKFPVASFILTAHCFQVCIAKMELLFSGALYFMFWAGGLAFSVKVYLNLGCLSALDNSIICVTRIPYCCCCCYPYSTFVTKVKYQHQLFCRWRTEAEGAKGHAQIYNAPGSCHAQYGLWWWRVWCEVWEWVHKTTSVFWVN